MILLGFRMFVIDNAQMQSFARQAREDFVDRMVIYTRDHFPKKFNRFGEAAMRRHAANTLDEAKSYGFETERQIVTFLDLGLLCGRFQSEAWAAKYLNPDSGEPEQRLRALRTATFRATGRIR